MIFGLLFRNIPVIIALTKIFRFLHTIPINKYTNQKKKSAKNRFGNIINFRKLLNAHLQI